MSEWRPIKEWPELKKFKGVAFEFENADGQRFATAFPDDEDWPNYMPKRLKSKPVRVRVMPQWSDRPHIMPRKA